MVESDQITVIGPDASVTGEMIFEKTARIVGTFEGKIHTKGELQISAGAQCKASIEAQSLTVDGSLMGDVRAGQIVQLHAKANVRGDVTATKLVVAEGASLVGHVAVGADVLKSVTTGSPTEAMAGSMSAKSAASSP